ncbi:MULTISPECIES: hypothetical protein [unclassified Streptomyces]|uniref:hypothetical protein n=1 Tax=unclassified Streptomyces TaxID=2593676 RepID=UPI00225A8356|nr:MULTISPECIES: hypothetical protein [unclassified Streptomyces]MCX4526268.1 hypothetical protein [Streptomyces sp. NBC_01551]MCX4543168.1 hypothetical protein [Streptomyces sp. NBC_01565]
MGIKDQFQDKAEELRNKAQQAQQGAKDEASERAAQQPGDKKRQGKPKAPKVHDELDDNWDI